MYQICPIELFLIIKKKIFRLRTILNVYLNFCRDQKRTEEKLDVELGVLFLTISAKMERIHHSSCRKGFVLIDHYSSKTGQWRHLEFDANLYHDAMAEVRRIEAAMAVIPDVVKRTRYDQLSHLRFAVRPCVKDTKYVGVFLELQNEIKTLKMRIAESETSRRSEETERLRKLLKELQSLTITDCLWEILESIKKNIKKGLRKTKEKSSV